MAPRFTTFSRGKAFIKGGGRAGNTAREISTIVTDYKRFAKVVDAEAERILTDVAGMILEAANKYVPVDTGALISSGRATVQKGPKGPGALVYFGGENNPVTPTKNAPTGIVNYAVIVHEMTIKFLELAVIDTKEMVNHYITTELKKLEPSPKKGKKATKKIDIKKTTPVKVTTKKATSKKKPTTKSKKKTKGKKK